jgi:cardiolipin synthase (CMP-forming)
MNIPNFITIGRILLVPVTIWFLISYEFGAAFAVFLIAGLSDGVDGWLARITSTQTELGAYLDPIADKALLVSTYATLGIIKILPAWLVFAVITRDVLIVGGVILARLMDKPIEVKPLMISKANTVLQIAFVVGVLGMLSLDWQAKILMALASYAVLALTVLSGLGYMMAWAKLMNGTSAK